MATTKSPVGLPHNGSFAAGIGIAASATPGVGTGNWAMGGLAASRMKRRGFWIQRSAFSGSWSGSAW